MTPRRNPLAIVAAIALLLVLVLGLLYGLDAFDQWWDHRAGTHDKVAVLGLALACVSILSMVSKTFRNIFLLVVQRYAVMGLVLVPFLLPVITWAMISQHLRISPLLDAWIIIIMSVVTVASILYVFVFLPRRRVEATEGRFRRFLRRVEALAPTPFGRLGRASYQKQTRQDETP